MKYSGVAGPRAQESRKAGRLCSAPPLLRQVALTFLSAAPRSSGVRCRGWRFRLGGAATDEEGTMEGQETYDELVAAMVERALAPWRELLPAEALAAMRHQLEDFITTHPAMDRMVQQLAPAKVVASSGEVPKDGAAAVDASSESTGTGGRK
ncbi:MAG: hypothetical protein WKG00_11735 [Polyangiaceae bacterium]